MKKGEKNMELERVVVGAQLQALITSPSGLQWEQTKGVNIRGGRDASILLITFCVMIPPLTPKLLVRNFETGVHLETHRMVSKMEAAEAEV